MAVCHATEMPMVVLPPWWWRRGAEDVLKTLPWQWRADDRFFSVGRGKNSWICTEFQRPLIQQSETEGISSFSKNSSGPEQSQPWNSKDFSHSHRGCQRFRAAMEIHAMLVTCVLPYHWLSWKFRFHLYTTFFLSFLSTDSSHPTVLNILHRI